MRLKPLEKWICDTCEQVIASPAQGQVEWLRDEDGRSHGFRICHHAAHSPSRLASGAHPALGPSCYTLGSSAAMVALKDMTGSTGMARMISFIDVGTIHDEHAEHLLCVKDLRSWTETFRRLFFPYYEEARLHFAAAEADGFFVDASEVWPYTEEVLKRIIEQYGDD